MIMDNWIQHKEMLRRQFSVMSQTSAELLTFSINDIFRMRSEFSGAYSTLFNDGYDRLVRAHQIKL